MKLLNLTVDSFLGIRHAEMPIGNVTVIAGDNWAGKSSIQQAIRVALSGEVARVTLKGEYKLLVKDGAKRARIDAEHVDNDGVRLMNTVDIPTSGKATIPNCDSDIIKICLDQEIIPNLAANDEKSLLKILFTAGGADINTDRISKRMLELGADSECVDTIAPYLTAGFDGAQAEAKERTKGYRTEWKLITGQNYGKDKADEWKREVDVSAMQETARMIPAHEKALTKLKRELSQQEQVVENAKVAFVAAQNDYTCSECGHTHQSDSVVVQALQAAHEKEYGGLSFIKTQVLTTETAIENAKHIETLIASAENNAKEETEAASLAHKNAQKWSRIEELLAPDGIMQEILSESLKPINERLTFSAGLSGLGQVAITPDLTITYDNRLYGLCSEAQKWVAQAMLTEAIAFLTGVNMVSLDRIDVLSVPNRGKLLKWCMALSDQTQFILFGTLKSKPVANGLTSYWIENGEIS